MEGGEKRRHDDRDRNPVENGEKGGQQKGNG